MMDEARRLTNVIVAHKASLLEKIETSCPHGVCEVRVVNFSNAGLR
jgi:hypothetical protein